MTHNSLLVLAALAMALFMSWLPVRDYEQNMADEVLEAPNSALLAQKE